MRRQLPALAILVVGLVISFVTTAFVRDWESREMQTMVVQASAGYVEALKGQLIRSMEVLYAIESFFEARKEVSRNEFRAFVSGTLARRPELQGLAWDPRVPGSARTEWESKAQDDGFASFRFVEQKEDGQLGPASERREYFPVYFMENLDRNEPALGFDLGSEQKRRAALEQARDTGLPAATSMIRLVQESGSQLGFLVLLPVYDGVASTVAERREKLKGFAAAVFRIGDLVDASLQAAVGRGIGVSIFDAATGQEIYKRGLDSGKSTLSWQTNIDVAGQLWTLVFEPEKQFFRSRRWQAWASLAAGIAISVLLAGYLWSHARRLLATEERIQEATMELSAEIAERKRIEQALRSARDDLEQRVRSRTAELAASNEALQAEVVIRQRAENEAASANRAKSTFLANMSHEIRTPLNAILGYAQILLRHDALDAFQRDAVKTIATSSDHLLHLINEILDLSKIDAGRMELVRADFDLGSLVHELAVMFRPLCEEKGLHLRIEGPGVRRSAPVVGDVGKLRQVLINLLGNAVKFTECGSVTLRLLDQRDGRFRFEVEDTGPGIPADIRGRVFEPFQQGYCGIRKGGTGLGLTIARRQVELMGGTLAVSSNPRQGSLFYFTLCLPAAPVAGELNMLSVENWRLEGGLRVRALVVDDVVENRRVLSTMLRMTGCETIMAENAGQALAAVHDLQPDIIFMDIRLPEVDGIEAIRRIRNEVTLAGIRVVATSASVLDRERERCLAAGCDDFLAKPFRTEQIYACLANLLDVRFVQDNRPKDEHGMETVDLTRITLPEDLVSRISRAAELHSATGVRKCLDELEQLEPGGSYLAKHLRSFLSSYDMDVIQRVVGQIPTQPVAVHRG